MLKSQQQQKTLKNIVIESLDASILKDSDVGL